MTVNIGGATIDDLGLVASGITVYNDGLVVTATGVSIINGGLAIMNGGQTVSDGGLIVEAGGMSVFGGLRVSNGLTVYGGIFTDNPVTVTPSDRRLKRFIRPLTNALSRVTQLRGVHFRWEESDEKPTSEVDSIGIIAQEVEKIFPEIVSENENGYKQVKYHQLLPLLIESIRELHENYEELQERFEEVVSRLKESEN